MRPIICEIYLIKLFISEKQTYYCIALFAHMCLAACAHHDIQGGWVLKKFVKYCNQDNCFTLKFIYIISKLKVNETPGISNNK